MSEVLVVFYSFFFFISSFNAQRASRADLAMAITDIRGEGGHCWRVEDRRYRWREAHSIRAPPATQPKNFNLLSPLSSHAVIAALAVAFSLGLALQGAACYANFWPLLTALAYLLFPMPSLFFSESAPGVAKWLTGFSTTAAAGIVATLWHAGRVPGKAAALQVAAVGVLCGTWGAYDRLAKSGDGYY